MKYPFVLPCPICGETPKTFEIDSTGGYSAVCPNCGFNLDEDDNDEPAQIWNYAVRWWYRKQIPIKQCPKCKNNDEDWEYNIGVERRSNGYRMKCVCGHAGPFTETIPAALVAWNKQPEPENVTTQD